MIVIYITDARTQYPPTVLTTLGLPIGAIQPYRYRLKWIQPWLRDRWRANQLVGQPTLICYLEGNSGDLKGARAFCVRTGTVVRSEIEHAYGIVQVEPRRSPPSGTSPTSPISRTTPTFSPPVRRAALTCWRPSWNCPRRH